MLKTSPLFIKITKFLGIYLKNSKDQELEIFRV